MKNCHQVTHKSLKFVWKALRYAVFQASHSFETHLWLGPKTTHANDPVWC